MLNFKNFVQEVAEQTKKQPPVSDCQICVIAPNFYLDGYYEAYKEGKTVEEIGEMIWEHYRQFADNYDGSYGFDADRDWIQNHVVYRIVNKDANEEMLKETPHIVLEDLAIVFYLLVEQQQQQIASIRISYSFLGQLGLQEEELLALADKNARRLFPVYFAPITETICHFDGETGNAYVFFAEEEDADYERQREFLESVIKEESVSPFFVLTNASGINGASVMLYSHVLKQIAEILESNLYIIPSSIHEVLVIPWGTLAKSDINAMIQTVNANMILKEEILSDHVYIYDPVLEQITC